MDAFTKKDARLTSIGTGNEIRLEEKSTDYRITRKSNRSKKMDRVSIPSSKSYVAITFTIAIFGLGILLLIE